MWESQTGELIRSLMGERLTDIAFWFEPELVAVGPHCIELSFGPTSFWIVVQGEDDTVQIQDCVATDNLVQNGIAVASVREELRGLRMTWARTMLNQQGYQDGFQIDFESDESKLIRGLELVALASALSVRLYVKKAP